MSDVILYLTLASSITVILFIVALLRRASSSSSAVQKEEEVEEPRRPRNVPTVQVRRVGGRVVRSRLHRTREATTYEETERRNDTDDDDFDLRRVEDDDENEEDDSSIRSKFPAEKIGTKKRKKLEMKAEKKANQEQEMQMREERKKRQELLDEQRKKEDEAAREEEAKKEEMERLQKEEKARQEQDEYLKLKETFAIESEGFDAEGGENEGEDLLKQFINYIKDEKVVILEDLAARFKLKTQDAISRVNSLLESEDLIGVIDDRGKFIYISMDELQSVAKFIRQRGRVTISELAESSNVLINMNPNENVQVAPCQ